MMQESNQLLLPQPDFERIFRTIHGVLLHEDGDLTRACTFFNIIGAAILRYHYHLNAGAFSGFAAYKLGESDDDVLTLAGQEDGALVTEHDAFHCWVQCDDWFLDFTSPLFREVIASAGSKKTCERKMFQQPRAGMCSSYSALQKPGDFFYDRNRELSKSVVKMFFSMQPYKDILNICVDWYRPAPEKMQDVIPIGGAAGQVKETRLSPLVLTGAW